MRSDHLSKHVKTHSKQKLLDDDSESPNFGSGRLSVSDDGSNGIKGEHSRSSRDQMMDIDDDDDDSIDSSDDEEINVD